MLNIVNYLNENDLIKVLNKYNVFDITTHEHKVSIYALRLLNSLNPYYGFRDEERNLLNYTSLLHDIGYFINKESHHNHTKYIILNEPLLDDIPKDLRRNLAFIASGHGKFVDETLVFHSQKEKDTALKLLSILRIADALDHKHNLGVSLETVEIKNHTLNIQIKGDASNIISKKVKKRSKLFIQLYNIPINVECILP
ncbi:HD domain-containing protein [Clostridium lacusfryxellense]|uniref:HD domain-containing protein n=1 Tax=Clostridium lacusfryxellense TaxID=205328 RepID=UPI001C0B8B00|nr:HD domain-containing protein [Clostridium lacusfryxellense]MBU3112546.1 HD domain-containing protein [Clostridium lacusfryxellense]